MDLLEEVKKIYNKRKVTGLLPQNLEPGMLDTLYSTGCVFRRNGRPREPSVAFAAFEFVIGKLWMYEEDPGDYEIETFAIILGYQKLCQMKIVKLKKPFTPKSVFERDHPYSELDPVKLEAFKLQEQKNIAQRDIDIEKN